MHYRPKTQNTAATVIDGEAIIVNLTNGVYYSMDKVGAEVWEMMGQGRSVEQMSAAVAARYETTPENARADIEFLAAKLIAEDIVEPSVEPLPVVADPVIVDQRSPYTVPSLEIYRDMGDLLALDPPMPGLRDIPLRQPAESSGP